MILFSFEFTKIPCESIQTRAFKNLFEVSIWNDLRNGKFIIFIMKQTWTSAGKVVEHVPPFWQGIPLQAFFAFPFSWLHWQVWPLHISLEAISVSQRRISQIWLIQVKLPHSKFEHKDKVHSGPWNKLLIKLIFFNDPNLWNYQYKGISTVWFH